MRQTRISCFTNSYGRFGAQAALSHLPSTGIQWLELPIRTAGVRPFFGDEPLITTDATPEDIARIKRRIADAGLKLSSCNLTSGNPLDETVRDITRRKLDIAAAFEVDLVVAGAGEAQTDAERDTLYRHLEQISEYAQALGIVYCFETHPGLCRDPDSMLETMERLDHPSLKLNFDTGNILYYNQDLDVGDSLMAVREHVRHVHLKDTNGRFGDWHFPELGAGGAIDFALVKWLLDEVDYTGPYSLEIEGIEGEPELSLAEYQRRIEESIAHLEHCGYFDR